MYAGGKKESRKAGKTSLICASGYRNPSAPGNVTLILLRFIPDSTKSCPLDRKVLYFASVFTVVSHSAQQVTLLRRSAQPPVRNDLHRPQRLVVSKRLSDKVRVVAQRIACEARVSMNDSAAS
jgi:hypothetical protein